MGEISMEDIGIPIIVLNYKYDQHMMKHMNFYYKVDIWTDTIIGSHNDHIVEYYKINYKRMVLPTIEKEYIRVLHFYNEPLGAKIIAVGIFIPTIRPFK